MSDPYYQDDHVTLYHGDCREITEWLAADVLVTDPPYGLKWSQGARTGSTPSTPVSPPNYGIVGDSDTSIRDTAIDRWGDRIGLVFGSPLAPHPAGAKQALVWQKPAGSGLFGARAGWRRDWEVIYMIGPWPQAPARRSAVLRTLGAPSDYTTGTHPHAKPVGVMEQLIAACPNGAIADPFAGAGSTLLAARFQGRKAIGVEIEELYCERAAKRLFIPDLFSGGVA